MHAKDRPKKKLNSILAIKIVTVAFIVTCIFAAIMVVFMAVQISENATASMKIAASYSQQLLDQMIVEAENINSLTQDDSNVQEMLRNRYTDQTEIYKQRLNINGFLSMLQHNYAQSADAFYIVLDDGRTFKSTNFPLRQASFVEEAWYKSIRSRDEVQWLRPYGESLTANNRKNGYVAVAYPLYNVRTGLSEGIVLVEIRTASIESIVQNGLMIEHGSVSVVDPSGNKIVDISNEPAASTLIEERVTLANGWQIVFSCAIVRSILQGLRPLCVVLIVILAGSFLMSTVVGRHVANGVSEPISELLAQMDASDDIRVRIKASIPSDIYEIDRLITNYNKLILRIQELFAELEQRSKEVKRSEFAALQAQINPHFLYNTLDTISWLIRRGRDEDALKTLMAFSQFFRISLNKGARNIPVRLEVRHAELYLNIQKMRFDSDFDFEIQNYLQTTDLENVHVPKLILQPLIENAIIHGIQPRMGQGKIVVAIERMGDELVFKVWDNGCGIPAEELRRINAGLQNANIDTEALSSNYGLSNVNLRIKHIFGESYGLRLESVEKEYTQAIINIPVKYDGGMDF